MAAEIHAKMSSYLQSTPFQLGNLVVGNIDYPEIVAKAVEKKLAAQQLLAEKDTQRDIAKRDAEIRIEEAKGLLNPKKLSMRLSLKTIFSMKPLGHNSKWLNPQSYNRVYPCRNQRHSSRDERKIT